MDLGRQTRVRQAFDTFFGPPEPPPADHVLGLFRRTAETVPAYRQFLREHGVAPGTSGRWPTSGRLPLLDKDGLPPEVPAARAVPRRPSRRARHDRRLLRLQRPADDLAACRSTTSCTSPAGSSRSWSTASTPTGAAPSPSSASRSAPGSAASSPRRACGTWRRRATRSPSVAPGNNKAEILRVLPELAPHFDQTCCWATRRSSRTSIDSGVAEGLDWHAYASSWCWPARCSASSGATWWRSGPASSDPCVDVASLYGTADAGVLGNETPLSVSIRRFLADRPELAREAVRRLAAADAGAVRPGAAGSSRRTRARCCSPATTGSR